MPFGFHGAHTSYVIWRHNPRAFRWRQTKPGFYTGEHDTQETVVDHAAEIVPHEHPEEKPSRCVESLKENTALFEIIGFNVQKYIVLINLHENIRCNILIHPHFTVQIQGVQKFSIYCATQRMYRNGLSGWNFSYMVVKYWRFSKCFHWIQWQKYSPLQFKDLNLLPLVWETRMPLQHQTKHMWETGSLNWAQFMLQWFIRFPEFAEFTEFNKSSAPFMKNSIVPVKMLRRRWMAEFYEV